MVQPIVRDRSSQAESADLPPQPSNGSNASSEEKRFVDSGVPWYYAYTVEFVLPATLPLGVVANVLSLLVLPRRSVKINARCKYLWLCALLADSLLVFFKDLADGWLDDGLYLLSGRTTFLHTELLSHAACKLFRGTCFLLEVLANYSTSAMLIERYLALRRPLWAKRALTLQRVAVAHAGVVLPLALLSFVFVCLTFGLVQTPGTLFGSRCMICPALGLFGLVVGVFAQQIQYTVHVLIDAVFDVLTLAELSAIRESSFRLRADRFSRTSRISMSSSASGGRGGREVRLTCTIASVALFRIVLYLPLAACVALYDVRSFQLSRTQSEFDQLRHAANLSQTLLLLTGIDRLMNFVLLATTVPTFRRVLCSSCLIRLNAVLTTIY